MDNDDHDQFGTTFMLLLTISMAIWLSGVVTASVMRGNEIDRLCGVLVQQEYYDAGCTQRHRIFQPPETN